MSDARLLKGIHSVVNIDQFVDDIEALTLFGNPENFDESMVKAANKAIEKRCAQELKLLQGHYALATRASYISAYRKAIGERFEGRAHVNTATYKKHLCHIAQKVMLLKKAGYKALKNQQQIGLEAKLVNRAYLADTLGYLKRAHELLHSIYWHDIAAGLMAVTGRRVAEIYKTAEFAINHEDWEIGSTLMHADQSVMFSGQLKKRSDEQDHYPIPVLAHPQMVITALRELRKRCDYTDIEVGQVNNRVGRTAGVQVRKQLGAFVEGHITAKSCRDIYVVLTMVLCTSYTDPVLLALYAPEVLGHEGGGAAGHYMPARLKRKGFEGVKAYMAEVWQNGIKTGAQTA